MLGAPIALARPLANVVPVAVARPQAAPRVITTQFQVGELVSYWSENKKNFFDARVMRIDPSGKVELDIKPGSLVSPRMLYRKSGTIAPALPRAVAPPIRIQALPSVAEPAEVDSPVNRKLSTHSSASGGSPVVHRHTAPSSTGNGLKQLSAPSPLPHRWCVGDKAEYFSESQGGFVPVEILQVNLRTGAVTVDARPHAPLSMEEARRKLRRRQTSHASKTCPAGHPTVPRDVPGLDCQVCGRSEPEATGLVGCAICEWDICAACQRELVGALQKDALVFRAGEKVEYYLPVQSTWMQTEIAAVHADGSVEVAAKPGHKIPKAEQPERVRKIAQAETARAEAGRQGLGDVPEGEVVQHPPQPPVDSLGSSVAPPMPTWAKALPTVPKGLEPSSVLHPRHPHHLLLRKIGLCRVRVVWSALTQGETHQCSLCNAKRLRTFYRCDACDFDLCAACAKGSVLYAHGAKELDPMKLHRHGGPSPHFTPQSVKEVQDFVKTLQLASDQGGEQVLKYLMTNHFRKFDTDGDKKLNLDELRELFNSMFGNMGLPPPQETLIAMYFSNFDTDRSGYIEFEEFVSLYKRLIRRVLGVFRMLHCTKPGNTAKRLFNEQFQLGKRLNAGAQGVTYLATDRATGMTVVVKKPNDCADTADFDLLKDKSHPNVVRVFNLFTEPHDTYVVMEFCSGGDLLSVLEYSFESFGGVTYNLIAGVMQQVMRGVQYIHGEFRQCHNDIKPENVLLERKPTTMTDVPRCMIADFGCAAGDGSGADGDPRYNAPELWRQGCVTYATDVWALGVMLFEMLSGGLLVFTDHENLSSWKAFCEYENGILVHVLQQAMESGREPDWSQIEQGGEAAANLCKQMLTFDPRRRIRLKQALQDPWFKVIEEPPQKLPDATVAALRHRAEKTEMKMALLNLVASQLQGACVDAYRSMWEVFDCDHSGVIDSESFVSMLVQQGIEEATARELRNTADLDKNGQIDFNEFVAVMLNPDELTSTKLEHQLRSIYFRLAGATGKLTYPELASQFSHETSVQMIQRLFVQMDTDCDGKVSYDEFSDYLSSL